MVSNEFKQEVFVEFLRRCAVCGYGSELNVLLIEPHLVSSDEDNRAENFICLCHECHTLAVRDRWGASVLREFRDKPWVARQFEGNGADEREKVKLTLTLKVDSESTDKTELLNFVKAAITGYTNGQTEK